MQQFFLLKKQNLKGPDSISPEDLSSSSSEFAAMTSFHDEECYWVDDEETGFEFSTEDDKLYSSISFRCNVGLRPAFYCEDISMIASEIEREEGHIWFEYGEYPQTIPDSEEQAKLDELYQEGNLAVTGKQYTLADSFDEDNFSLKSHLEYKYHGRKFIHFIDRNSYHENSTWAEVKPITWCYDEKHHLAYSKDILLYGIPFDFQDDTNFPNSYIRWFLNRCFAKEIENGLIGCYIQEDFSYQPVDQKEILKQSLLANIPVRLKSKNFSLSGEEGYIFLKQFDPTCERIFLEANPPEDFFGQVAYDSFTKQMVLNPPIWFKKWEDRCLKESDRQHILYLLEVPLERKDNSLPFQEELVQSIRNRNIRGVFPFPENGQIVFSYDDWHNFPNRLVDVLSPNRENITFSTVSMDEDTQAILDQLMNPMNDLLLTVEKQETFSSLHPIIYAYLSHLLEQKEDGPGYPNLFKWQVVSKLFEQSKSFCVLRGFLSQTELEDLLSFYLQDTLSVNDVLTHRYSPYDIENIKKHQKHITILKLVMNLEEENAQVRKFVEQFGDDAVDFFDNLFAYKNRNKREEKNKVKVIKQYVE